MKLNTLSRLTALLLAFVIAFSCTAVAETATDYEAWLDDAQAANKAYCTLDASCTYAWIAINEYSIEDRYDYLMQFNDQITDSGLTALHEILTHFGTYHIAEAPDALCTCWPEHLDENNNAILYPYQDSRHSSECPWYGEKIIIPPVVVDPPETEQPDLYEGTPNGNQYTSDLKVELEEGSNTISLPIYGRVTLTTTAAGNQWQVYTGTEWVDMLGETGSTLIVTTAKLQTIFNLNGVAQLRYCMVSGDDVTVLAEATVTSVPESAEDTAALVAEERAFTQVPREGDLVNYSVVINYVFENNTIVADPYTATLAAGSNFKATVYHPTVQGYLPSKGAEDDWNDKGLTYTASAVEIDLTNIAEPYEVTVVYQPTLVNYTVIHYQQNVDNDNYTIAETETLQGLTGSTVPEVANTYPGMYALLYEKPAIAADGSTVVEVYYDRNYYLMLFELDGGYGVEPIYARYGAAIGDVGTPTKAGYTFEGWSLDGTNEVALPDTMPAENRTYKALWKMGDSATVTLVFWGENADDTGYSPLPSMTITTTPGTEFTYDPNGSLICGKEEHSHSAACGYDCGYTEHSHSLADNCYTLTCTQSSHNHVNDGCTLNCKHVHTLDCYTAANDTKLVETSKPSNTLTSRGNGIYTYGGSGLLDPTHYVLNIGDKWYCSDGQILGDLNSISLDCNHSHGDECYTCGQQNSTHVHTVEEGCYELTCQIPAHTHTVDCYACGKTEHTHTSDCYQEGAGLDSNLWVFEKSDTVTVAADGSSVVNVYYKRTTKTLTFKYNYDTQYRKTETITAKWGEDISDEYEAIAENCGSTFWSKSTNGGGPYTNYFGIMPTTSATYYHRSANGSTGSMMYYGQDLNGDYSVKLFQVDNVGGYSVTVEDRYEFEGFTYHHGTSTGSSCSGATFYYTRNTYDIEFYNPTDLLSTVENVYYEAPLGQYDFTPTPDQAPDSYEPGSVQFEGWYLNPECTGEKYILANHTMPVGAENGEVALTLYANWVPVTRTVSFYLDKAAMENDTSDSSTKLYPDVTVPHGTKVETVPATPENGAYKFIGWFYMDGDVEKAFDFANMPITKDMKVYGKWSSDVLKEYIVYYKAITETDAEGNPVAGIEIADPITGSTLAGETKTFDAKGGEELKTGYQEGYFPLVASHSMTLDINTPEKAGIDANGTEWVEITNADGTKKIVQSFTFWYVQKDAVPYTVYYVTEEQNAAGDLLSIELNGKTYYIVAETYTNSENRKAVVTETFKPVAGYMPDAYQKRLVVTTGGVDSDDDDVEDQNVIIFYYTVDSTHAYYKITHYTQNTDGQTYTEYASSQAQGVIGETYSADPLTIDGFTYDENNTTNLNVVSGTLPEEGMELKLYYLRNSYPYEVRYLEQGTGKPLAEPTTGSGLYGKVVSENAIVIPGYTAVEPTSETLTIRIEESQTEAKLNIITFYYTEEEVTINYVPVGPEGATNFGSVTPTSETLKVLSGRAQGSTATANAPTYKFVGWFSDKECTKQVDKEATYVPTKAEGTVWLDGTTYYALFELNVGELAITKKVNNATDGTVAPAGDVFTFLVSLPDGEYTYTVGGTTSDSKLVVQGGKGELSIKANEDVVIKDVVINSQYKVSEVEKHDYFEASEPVTGQIAATGSAAEITNTYLTGNLVITKSVDPAAGAPDDTFTMNVTLTLPTTSGATLALPTTYTVTAGGTTATMTNVAFTSGKSTPIALKAGQTATIVGLPYGTTYEVTEATPPEYYNAGADYKFSDSNNKIDSEANDTVTVTNTYNTGTLEITKTVVGNAPSADEFAITVALTLPNDLTALPGSVKQEVATGVTAGNVSVENGVVTQTFTGVQHDGKITISGLPVGTEYAVLETEKPDYYTVAYTDQTGTVTKDGAVAVVTNTYHSDSLTITKEVLPEGTNTGDTFTIDVTLELPNDNGATVSLEHIDEYINVSKDVVCATIDNGFRFTNVVDDTRIVFGNLPYGTKYTVTEINAPGYYEVAIDNANATIDADNQNPEVTITNTYLTGSLEITKTVVGEGMPTTDTFTIEVKFTLPDGNATIPTTYTKIVGDASTSVEFTANDGKVVIDGVKSSDKYLFEGLPYGTTYSVTEKTPAAYYNADCTYVDSTEKKIGNATEDKVTITNTYLTGSLDVTKEVVGVTAPRGENGKGTDKFSFTLKLTLNSQPVKATIKLNDSELQVNDDNEYAFTLTDGETAHFTQLPANVQYTVTETAHPDYTTTQTGDTGVIAADTATETHTAEAKFTNTYKYGDLIITKTATGANAASSTFIFKVEGESFNGYVSITGSDSVTLKDLKPGSYTITEQTDWSYRFTEDKTSTTVTVVAGETKSADFINTEKTDKWLHDESVEHNVFGTTTTTTTEGGEQE